MSGYSRRRFLAACGALPVAAQQSAPATAWNQVYHLDADERQLSLLEIAFYSNRAAMGIGLLNNRGRIKPASIRTTDAGATWTLGQLKPTAFSVQFLDEANGWMAADNGVYKSTDAGQSWRRVLRNSKIRQVRFLDTERGYAAGEECTVLETVNGGEKWTPVAAASSFKTNEDLTEYTRIEFASPTLGFIVGHYSPPKPYRIQELPAWMDPDSARRRRQTPSLSLVLQTIDGGKVWKPTSTSLFGHITRLNVNDRGIGLSLVEFDESFDYASEVYLINLVTGKTDRFYREAERAITDVLALKDGSFLIAGVESPGRLRTAPIPTKVHILHGNMLGNWTEMAVDYRATARRVHFAQSPTGQMFACTDSGMVLRLDTPPGPKT